MTDTGPLIQNFSVPAGDAINVPFDISPDEGNSLQGCTVYWKAYEQVHGVPTVGVDPVLEKSTIDSDEISIDSETDLTFTLKLSKADTVALLGNYYHEVTLIDDDGNRATPTVGTMTVTQTENRDG